MFRYSDRYNYLPTRATLFDLYRSLNHSITVKTWFEKNYDVLNSNNIDIRRFIKFGITNGLIYRIYSHPVLSVTKRKRRPSDRRGTPNDTNSGSILLSTSDIKFDVGDKLLNSIYKKLSKVSFDSNSSPEVKNKSSPTKSKLTTSQRKILIESLDEFESFDKICVKLGKSRAEVEVLLKELGDYRVINA